MDSGTQSEKEAFWRTEMALFGKYSGSASAFCRSRGLSSFRFRYWAQKLGKTDAGRALVASPFLPVQVTSSKPSAARLPEPRWLAEFILHLSGGQS